MSWIFKAESDRRSSSGSRIYPVFVDIIWATGRRAQLVLACESASGHTSLRRKRLAGRSYGI
jgi:hypothetical protein